MKAFLQKDELLSLANELKILCNDLEDMIASYNAEIIQDSSFTGPMVDAYQTSLAHLLEEHKQMIEFYKELSQQLIEMEMDYQEKQNLLLNRINNI